MKSFPGFAFGTAGGGGGAASGRAVAETCGAGAASRPWVDPESRHETRATRTAARRMTRSCRSLGLALVRIARGFEQRGLGAVRIEDELAVVRRLDVGAAHDKVARVLDID